MHVAILLLAGLGAWTARAGCYHQMQQCRQNGGAWRNRWVWALGATLVPALWLLVAVLAVGLMGPHGTMFGYAVDTIGLWVSGGVVVGATVLLAALMVRVWQLERDLNRYPQAQLDVACMDREITVRTIAAPSWFAGQVGLLRPQLAIGQALLTQLGNDRLEAVIAHECAHAHYRDTLLFFFLGWLRRLLSWLPHTRELWEELILLRELRADRWAAQFVDPLLLAETLVTVARSSATEAPDRLEEAWVGFHDFSTVSSFEARIEALIETEVDRAACETGSSMRDLSVGSWLWCALACFPLLAVPFHHL